MRVDYFCPGEEQRRSVGIDARIRSMEVCVCGGRDSLEVMLKTTGSSIDVNVVRCISNILFVREIPTELYLVGSKQKRL